MNNTLITETDEDSLYSSDYKKVTLSLQPVLLYNGGNPQQPLFLKKSFRYDKYELAKITSFENFQLLFRSFRDTVVCQRFFLLAKLVPLVLIIFILTLISQILMATMGSEKYFTIFYLAEGVIMFLVFFILFYSIFFRNKILQQLQRYVTNLHLNHLNIQLRGIEGYVNCCQKYSHLSITSLTIKEDFDYAKVYCKEANLAPFRIFSPSMEQPIIKASEFIFDKRKLNNFLPFEQLEQVLRPFVNNETYKKCLSHKYLVATVLLLPIVIMIITIVFVNNIGLAVMMMIACVFMVFLLFIGLIVKANRQRSNLMLELKRYCCKLNEQSREEYSIIAHFVERNEKKKWFEAENVLYCFQIKKKEKLTKN